MKFIFADFIKTTLAAALSNTATSMSVANATGIPSIGTGEQLAFVLNDAATGQNFEVVYATAISGTTVTIERGQESTSAQNWLLGDYVWSANTSGVMASLLQSAASSFAPAAGNPAQAFEVADATTGTQDAIPIIQADARYAPIAGNSAQTFEAANATTSSEVTTLGQIDGTYAPLASPALTGTPTAPTAAANTNTTQLATTANVVSTINAQMASPSTGLGSTTPNTVAATTVTSESGTGGQLILGSGTASEKYIAGSGGAFGTNASTVFNVPTGQGFEFAINGADVMTLDGTTLTLPTGAISAAAISGLAASLSGNGYIDIPTPSGTLLVNWGPCSSGSGVSFAKAFSSSVFSLVVSSTANGDGTSVVATGYSGLSNSGFTPLAWALSGSGVGGRGMAYVAFGV